MDSTVISYDHAYGTIMGYSKLKKAYNIQEIFQELHLKIKMYTFVKLVL